MSTYLQSIGSQVWEICEDADYVVLAARNGQEQIDQHKANSMSRNAIFSCLSLSEFEWLSHLTRLGRFG